MFPIVVYTSVDVAFDRAGGFVLVVIVDLDRRRRHSSAVDVVMLQPGVRWCSMSREGRR